MDQNKYVFGVVKEDRMLDKMKFGADTLQQVAHTFTWMNHLHWLRSCLKGSRFCILEFEIDI